MPKQLNLSVDNNSDALERVLRVVRHRGFAVRRFEALLPQGEGCMDVVIEVESGRSLFSLVAQLAKLVEVRSLAMRGEGVRVLL
ncbi:acetolactate synthase 2 small subunit [Chitinimonas arctica]|uniref:Acetolactate synthase 2 small subunit n=1 Tax=Chitinimonas arctica TaxID=2594795 RepID=A0A516SCV6_9NEIS|nr:acetolactate synthase 2 small subunit [Chitinimonas arctica]QDQ25974.1 acetolactate synthase 2 small subunit [Chitinimonas arctica]